MVKKFRWQEIRRKIWSPADPPSSRSFSEPEWQRHVSLWYIFYRWLIFGCWTGIIICSILDVGSYHPEGKKETWPIYVTHWGLVLGVAQAFFGGIIVTKRRKLQRQVDFDPEVLVLGTTERIYWILYTLTSSMAIAITVIYWSVIYDPRIHIKDPLNFLVHLCNSVLILIDLIIVRVPIRIEHVWWPITFIFTYIFFTVIYYLAGGLDKHGFHHIYKVLDWQRPGRSVLICLGVLIFTTVIHCVLCSLSRLRFYVCSKIMTTTINLQTVTKTESPVSNSVKSVELIV